MDPFSPAMRSFPRHDREQFENKQNTQRIPDLAFIQRDRTDLETTKKGVRPSNGRSERN